MAGKLSPGGQQKLDLLTQARRKTDRIHGLVEQYASTGQDVYVSMIARAAAELGRLLLGAGWGVMGDYANTMGQAAKRGGATQGKFRSLREAVALLRPALDRAERQIYDEEKAAGAGDAG